MLKIVEGSLLVSPPILLAIIVVLHLEFKFSHILPIGVVILAGCIIFRSGKMLHFHNPCHSFLKILYFFVLSFGIPLSQKNLHLLIGF